MTSTTIDCATPLVDGIMSVEKLDDTRRCSLLTISSQAEEAEHNAIAVPGDPPRPPKRKTTFARRSLKAKTRNSMRLVQGLGLETAKDDHGRPMDLLRHAVYATMFVNRLSKHMGGPGSEWDEHSMLDVERKIGSLNFFLDTQKLGSVNEIFENIPDPTLPAHVPDPVIPPLKELGVPLPRQPLALGPDPPPPVAGGRRRVVSRAGDKVSAIRTACPRQQQLRQLLPALPGSARQTAPASCTSSPGTTRGRGPDKAAQGSPDGQRRGQEAPQTNFTAAFIGGSKAKPRAEPHPLLTAMEHGDGDDAHLELDGGEIEQATLAHRLDELRSGALPRSGQRSGRQDRRKAPMESSTPHPAHSSLGAYGVGIELPVDATSPVGASQVPREWQTLVKMLDPEGSGFVSPEMFVPLMFWLGLTRRRSAALATVEVAFGPGDINVNAILDLTEYMEVQLRLVEGLRRLARRESLEQLCEFMTDSDRLRLRTWFNSMKTDTNGLVEVQNLFARMEVTSDRQVLFRFLGYVARNRPSAPSHSGNAAPASTSRKQKTPSQRKMGVDDFASLICRCTVTWCLHRMIGLITSPDPASSVFGDFSSDHDLVCRWTQLQRKIVVSLLVNHSFWGRESRQVLINLKPPSLAQINDDLTPEQWVSLFQRVRAQGMASTLPVGDEAEDPAFLRKKVEHDWVDRRK